MSQDQDFDQKMRDHRVKNFCVRVVPIQPDFRDFEDEKRLEVTYNGRQWTPIQLTKMEAAQVIAELRAQFDL